jgi:hypothetical protein
VAALYTHKPLLACKESPPLSLWCGPEQDITGREILKKITEESGSLYFVPAPSYQSDYSLFILRRVSQEMEDRL